MVLGSLIQVIRAPGCSKEMELGMCPVAVGAPPNQLFCYPDPIIVDLRAGMAQLWEADWIPIFHSHRVRCVDSAGGRRQQLLLQLKAVGISDEDLLSMSTVTSPENMIQKEIVVHGSCSSYFFEGHGFAE